jgi:phospholipase C
MRRVRCRTLAVAVIVSLCTSCASRTPPWLPPTQALTPAETTPSSPGRYIKHIVVIVQENRSFENIFAGWPGADAPAYGYLHTGKRVALQAMTYADDCARIHGYQYCDMGHLWQEALTGWNNGKMNGFDLNRYGAFGTGPLVHRHPYSYLDHAEIASYRAMASQYVLVDHMFPTEFGTSFTAHQDLIAGTTRVDARHSLVNVPLPSPPWGCDAYQGTTTSLVDRERKITGNGPFPCLDIYPTLADTLDAAGISWKYYAPPQGNAAGGVWSAFSAIKDVYDGPDWKRNVISPETKVFDDIKAGTLPSVAWVIPDFKWSDHPATPSNWGPSWVADVVDEVGKSAAWPSTAIVVLWDDWGGWYDSAPPPQLDYLGLGLRVPCIIISPYARKGHISHTRYEFGSILKFIEQTFKLQSLGSTDVRANSLVNAFDFTQKPRAFVPFATNHPPSFFRKQHPSHQPPDSD